MKTTRILLLVTLLVPVAQAGEKDVWYNAKGEVAAVTPVIEKKEAFVPKWKKDELAREANRAARRDSRVRHSGNRYYYVYPGYGSCYGGYYFPRYRGRYPGYSCHPHWRFSGFYQGDGWSVRLGF